MSEQLPEDVVRAIRSGNKIEAIKLLREQTGIGLKEAKEWVEADQAGQPRPSGSMSHGAVERRAGGGQGIAHTLARLYRQICIVLFVAFFWVLLAPGLSFTDAGRWLDRQLDSAMQAMGFDAPEPDAQEPAGPVADR